jgi:hypothetical protein
LIILVNRTQLWLRQLRTHLLPIHGIRSRIQDPEKS